MGRTSSLTDSCRDVCVTSVLRTRGLRVKRTLVEDRAEPLLVNALLYAECLGAVLAVLVLVVENVSDNNAVWFSIPYCRSSMQIR